MVEQGAHTPRLLRILSKRLFMPIVGWFFFTGSLPLIALGIGYYRHVFRLLQKEYTERLGAIAQRQVNTIEDSIQQQARLLEVFSGTRRMAALVPALQKARQEENEALQEELNVQCDTLIGQPSRELGFLDMVLFDTDGHALYTASKTNMFQLGALSDEFRYPNLAMAFKRAIIHLSTQVAKLDLESTYGAPAFFMVTPIIIEQRLLAVGVVRLGHKEIHRIANDYNGLGFSGETLLVSAYKDDFVLFNASRFGLEPGLNQVISSESKNQDLIHNALQKGSSTGAGLDYRQERVVAAWNYMPSVHWGILVKSDVTEIAGPMAEVRHYAFFVGSLTLILLVFASSFVAASLSQPFRFFARATSAITQGRLYFNFGSVGSKGQLELFGIVRFLLENLSKLRAHLDKLLNKGLSDAQAIIEDVEAYTDTNRNLKQYVTIISHNANRAGQLFKETTRSLERTRSITERIAQEAETNMEDLKVIRDTFAELCTYNADLIERFDLIDSATAKTQILQTHFVHLCDNMNLIYVNAMIEARKAGIQGRGFRVIAQEIQKLSKELCALGAEMESCFYTLRSSSSQCVNQSRDVAEKIEMGSSGGLHIATQLFDVIQQVQALPSIFEDAALRSNQQGTLLHSIESYAKSMGLSNEELQVAFGEIQKSLECLQKSSITIQKAVRRFHA